MVKLPPRVQTTNSHVLLGADHVLDRVRDRSHHSWLQIDVLPLTNQSDELQQFVETNRQKLTGHSSNLTDVKFNERFPTFSSFHNKNGAVGGLKGPRAVFSSVHTDEGSLVCPPPPPPPPHRSYSTTSHHASCCFPTSSYLAITRKGGTGV